jgi:MarR family transcriptional regulator, 2-MHQ and catechol-resistance regulon repressor
MKPTDGASTDLTATSATAREPTDALGHELITLAGLLFEAEAALEQRIAATLRDHGLATGAFEVLLRLGRSEGDRLRMSELSRRLAITTGGTTRLMDRLERDGLVRRVPSTSDRRVIYAELTSSGRAELERAIGPHLSDLTEIFTERLTPADRTDLERGLRALRDALLED